MPRSRPVWFGVRAQGSRVESSPTCWPPHHHIILLTHMYILLTHMCILLTHMYILLTHMYILLTHISILLTHMYILLTHMYMLLTHMYILLTHMYILLTHMYILLTHMYMYIQCIQCVYTYIRYLRILTVCVTGRKWRQLWHVPVLRQGRLIQPPRLTRFSINPHQTFHLYIYNNIKDFLSSSCDVCHVFFLSIRVFIWNIILVGFLISISTAIVLQAIHYQCRPALSNFQPASVFPFLIPFPGVKKQLPAYTKAPFM